jgi:hypothetical protein
MPLNVPPAPAASLASVATVLPRLLSGQSLDTHAPNMASVLRSVTSAAATLAAPGLAAASVRPSFSARTFSLGLDAILAGQGLAAAHLVLWTHVLPAGLGQQAVVAETAAASGEFAQLTDGPHAAAMQPALDRLRADPAIVSAVFNLALLKVPALFVSAMWLQGTGGAADILIPLDPAPQPLVAGQHYDAAAFLAALHPLAVRASADADPRKGG